MNDTQWCVSDMVVVRPTRAQDQFLALLMSSHPRCGARSTPRVLSVVPQLELASPTAPTSGRSTTLTSTAGDNNLLPREGGVGVPVLPSPILLRIMWEDYFCFGAVGIRALLDVCNNGEVHDYCSVCFRVSPLLLGVTSAVPSVIHETRWTEKYVDCTRFIRIPVPLSPEWSPERKRYNMIDTVTGKEWDLHWCRDLIDERLWDASKRWWVAVEGNKLTVTDLNLRVTGDGRGSDTPAKGSVLVAVPVNSKRRVVLAAELDKFHPNWLLVKRRYGESSTLLEVVDVAQTHCSGKYTVLSTSIATFQYDRSFQFLMRKTKGGRSINVWIVHSFHPSPFSAYLYELEEGSCLLGCLPPLYFLEDFSSVSQISKSVFCVKSLASQSLVFYDCNEPHKPLRVVQWTPQIHKVVGAPRFVILSTRNEINVAEAACSSPTVVLTVNTSPLAVQTTVKIKGITSFC